MAESETLLRRIEKLEARNKRVETDKAWETSWVRRGAVMVLTYAVVVVYLGFVVHINPWINALVPVIGFFLSTLTISLLKNAGRHQTRKRCRIAAHQANIKPYYDQLYALLTKNQHLFG